MRISILPKSLLGRWSVGLAAAFILLRVLFQTFFAGGGRNPVQNPGTPSPVILIAVVTGYVSGVVAFVTGLLVL